MINCKACKQDKEDHWFRLIIKPGREPCRERTCLDCWSKKGTDQRRDRLYEMPKSFEQMLKEQNGLCLICKKEPQKKELAVDHCHLTDKVRGLLCTNCNLGLGYFNEDVELLRAAIEYLTK